MSIDRLNAELDAFRTYAELLEKAGECLAKFERANVPAPDSLRRLMEPYEVKEAANGQQSFAYVGLTLDPSNRPAAAKPDWVSVDIGKAMSESVVLAVLRAADEPLPAREVATTVLEILPDMNPGSIPNIGTRLSGIGVIKRGDAGWEIVKRDRSGVIHEGRIWGPPSVFSKQELASRRREAVLAVLGQNSAGLQTSQIVQQLRDHFPNICAPVSKDLVKADVEHLVGERKIRRRGNTLKWEIAPSKEEDNLMQMV